MKKQHMGGFTIIETLLFLAGSSFLILVAMTSISGRNSQVQFTDGMRGLQSFLSQRLNYSQNGIARTDNAHCQRTSADIYNTTVAISDGSCLLLGYAMQFTPGSSDVAVHQVFGRNLPADDSCLTNTPQDIFYCVRARSGGAPPAATETYNIAWGITFTNSSPNNSTGFGYLRSPQGGNTLPVVYKTYNPATLPFVDYRASSANTDIGNEVEGYYCFKSQDGKRAKILIGTGRNDGSLQVDFTNLAGCTG